MYCWSIWMSCPASDTGHSEKIASTGLPQTHKTSAGVTFNLAPGPYASQVVLQLFGLNEKCYVWRKKNTAFQHKNLIPSVKHGIGGIMVWACFTASEPGRTTIIYGTISSELYQWILKENVRTSVRELNLKRKCVMQEDNNPKHTICSTTSILLKGSYDVAKKNIIWCNAMCIRGSRFKKHMICHILYIVVGPYDFHDAENADGIA